MSEKERQELRQLWAGLVAEFRASSAALNPSVALVQRVGLRGKNPRPSGRGVF